MAGIKAPMLSIMNRLHSLGVFAHIRVWNNQVDYEKDGQMYDFPKPAAFLEVVNEPAYEQLGGGVQTADVAFRIHIVAEEYDAGYGTEAFDMNQATFEQNLSVFDLRDKVCGTAGLSLFQPTGTGPLTKAVESQDYEHDNIYHYMIDFVAAWIDATGSPYDPANGNIITGTVTDIAVTGQIVDSIPGSPDPAPQYTHLNFIMPQTMRK